MPPKACSSFYIGKVNRKVVTDTQSSWQSSPAPATINGPIKMAVGTPGMSRPGWMWGHRILRHGSLSLPLDSSLLFHSTASTKLTWNRIPHYHRDRIKKNKRHKTFFYNLLDAIKRTHILGKKSPKIIGHDFSVYCTSWRKPVVQIHYFINIYQSFSFIQMNILVYKIKKIVEWLAKHLLTSQAEHEVHRPVIVT